MNKYYRFFRKGNECRLSEKEEIPMWEKINEFYASDTEVDLLNVALSIYRIEGRLFTYEKLMEKPKQDIILSTDRTRVGHSTGTLLDFYAEVIKPQEFMDGKPAVWERGVTRKMEDLVNFYNVERYSTRSKRTYAYLKERGKL